MCGKCTKNDYNTVLSNGCRTDTARRRTCTTSRTTKTAMQNCAVHVMLRSFKQKSNILFRGGSSLSSGVCIKTGGRGAEEGQSLVYKNSVSVCDWCIIRAADTVTRLFFNVNTANAK